MNQLTDQQLTAIDCLLSGQNQTQTAASIGIDRITLWRWLTESSQFQVELNRRRADIWQANSERIRALAGRAIDVLESALDSDSETVRLRAAALLLKAVSLADAGRPDGETDPDRLDFEKSLQSVF